MDAKNLMIDALEDLVDDDLKAFKWHLSSGMRPDIEPIPKGRLQKADAHDVVDCMVQKYSDEAGKVAIIALQKINQNDLAKRLDLKLQKGKINFYWFLFSISVALRNFHSHHFEK